MVAKAKSQGSKQWW